jgi:hypothetical protein
MTDERLTDPRTAFAAEPTVDLAGARVAVLGCGSVGGFAAWACASAGVRHLELADRDALALDNLRRHACGRDDLGVPKPTALARLLTRRFPGLHAVAHEGCFLREPNRLRRVIAAADVLLVAVDDEAPKHLIDAMARALGKPAVYAGVYGGGWAAEVVALDPAADAPCYACAARALGRAGVALDAAELPPAYALPVPGRAASGWPRADLTSLLPCAALAAGLVTARLARDRGRPQPWAEWTAAGACAWRFALRRVAPWDGGPWQLVPVPAPSEPACPTCGPRQPVAADLAALLESRDAGDGA